MYIVYVHMFLGACGPAPLELWWFGAEGLFSLLHWVSIFPWEPTGVYEDLAVLLISLLWDFRILDVPFSLQAIPVIICLVMSVGQDVSCHPCEFLIDHVGTE